MLRLLLVRLLLLLVYSEHSPNARERKQKEKCDDIGKKDCVYTSELCLVFTILRHIYIHLLYFYLFCPHFQIIWPSRAVEHVNAKRTKRMKRVPFTSLPETNILCRFVLAFHMYGACEWCEL